MDDVTKTPGNSGAHYGRFGSGKPVRRVEDADLLTGKGRFADDVSAPDQVFAYFLRSPHPHARIAAIDKSAAEKMPGVIGVVSGADLVRDGVKPLPNSADFKRPDGTPLASPPRHALAVDTVRFVGEAVAVVLAQTRVQAQDAMEAIDIRYDALPAVADLHRAIAANAPRVWDKAPDNIAAEARHGNASATEAAFRRAAHVVTLDLVNQRVAPCPIEPRALLASYDATTDRITITASSQMPAGFRDTLASEVLGIAPEKVRVLVGD